MVNEKKISLIGIFCTFSLLIVGGIVHSTESSLSCPDWPLCLGNSSSEFNLGVYLKISHRLLGLFVGLLNIVLFYLVKKNDKYSKKLKDLCFFSLIMVVVQGVLGGITVLYKIPVLVSTMHLALSMLYLVILVYIGRSLNSTEEEKTSWEDRQFLSKIWNPNLLNGLKISLGLLYSQIIFSAYIRHSGISDSCGLGAHNALKCLDVSTGALSWWPTLNEARLNMGHRLWGLFVVACVFYFCLKFIRFIVSHPKIPNEMQVKYTILGFVPVILTLIQLSFGIAVVAFNLNLVPATFHLAFSALSLISLWYLLLEVNDLQIDCVGEEVHTAMGDYFGLTKPNLTMLVLSTSLIGMLVAPGKMGFFHGLEFLIYMIGVVGGACALNCVVEIDVDKTMKRTEDRPLPSGRITQKSALVFGVFLSTAGLLGLLSRINFTTFLLGLLALVLYLFAYTPLKQKSLASLWTGAVSGALPPTIGWTAVTGELGAISIVMFLIMFVWQLPHFLSISLYHQKDYSNASILVYPNIYGEKVTKNLIVILTAILVLVSFIPFWLGRSNVDYRNASIILGSLFMVVAFAGLRKQDEELMRRWAKKYFWGSIIYLPLLFIFLLFFTE